MTSQAEGSASGSDLAHSLAPSEAEIEAWAAHERKRRQQWLSGPTPEQAAVAASREREAIEADSGRAHTTRGSDIDATRLVQRSMRTAQLALEGAMNLLLHVSLRDARERLVQAGLDWEEEFQEPTRGR
jgi:hypothetical protein